MNSYLSVNDVANKWGITARRVQYLCREKRIPGAVKKSGVWLIPDKSEKPLNLGSGKKSHTPRPLKVLSLFSGCGGMDLGIEGGFTVHKKSINPLINHHWKYKKIDNNWVKLCKTRFQTVFANDIRSDAKIAWTSYFSKRHKSKSLYYLDSIVDLVKLQKENGFSVFPKEIDVVTGGFPCQDFSVAGKRKGFASDKTHKGKIGDSSIPTVENRGLLYMWMREVISLTKPKLFIAENVKGLTNLSNVKEIIEKDFSSICDDGYLVVPARVLHAADYGVPQSRERVIFLGFRLNALKPEAVTALRSESIPAEYDPYPPVTHSSYGDGNILDYVKLRDIFVDLGEPNISKDIDQQKFSRAKYMGKHCQGQTEINLDGIGPTIRSEHHGNIEFRRLSKENGGKYLEELKAGLLERRLTIRECARIQTFPDDYNFVQSSNKFDKGVSASDAYKLIGNAVPPLLAYHISKRLEVLWEKLFI